MKSGKISDERLDQSVRRLLKVKAAEVCWRSPGRRTRPRPRGGLRSAEHQKVAQLSRRSPGSNSVRLPSGIARLSPRETAEFC